MKEHSTRSNACLLSRAGQGKRMTPAVKLQFRIMKDLPLKNFRYYITSCKVDAFQLGLLGNCGARIFPLCPHVLDVCCVRSAS